MAADYLSSWNPAAIVAAHTALLGLLDAGTGAASITLHDATDTLLATIPLTAPAGTVDSGTGALTLTPDGREESAPASGTAVYATIRDGDGAAYRSLECEAGAAAVTNKCVLNTTNIIAGGPVEVLSAVIS